MCSSFTNIFVNLRNLFTEIAKSPALATATLGPSHAIDLFGGSSCFDHASLLQVHVEMRSLPPNSTNGVVVLSDSFTTAIFKQSFLCIFNKDDQGRLSLAMARGFNTTSTFNVQSQFFPSL